MLSGAGSSDLIYLAFRAWLSRTSRVLILDPMYGEYAHLCEQNIECHLDRFVLEESADFAFDQVRFERRLQAGYDFIVLVNPNNPTGSYIRLDGIERILALLSTSKTLWIDEAYIDYVSDSTSLESVAAGARNLVVCKSLSKAYALSGVRAAYLVGHPETIATLRRWSPPWSVSLPAQLAGIEALKADEYYAARHAETETLRTGLAAGLKSIPGIVVISGLANFLLCRLTSMNRRMFLLECRARGLYLRDVSTMGHSMGIDIFRISVKDQNTNRRMLRIIQDVLANSS